MSMSYQPSPTELAADSTRAELDYLKILVGDVIQDRNTSKKTRQALTKALADAHQLGIDTFQYR